MTLQNYFQLWILISFLSMMYFSVIKNWKIYYPSWSTKLAVNKTTGNQYVDEYKILLYRLIIAFTSPLSWLYLIAKHVKTKTDLESS